MSQQGYRRRQRATAQAAMDMPAAGDAMAAISRAKERLRKLGWSDGIYCPKEKAARLIVNLAAREYYEASYERNIA